MAVQLLWVAQERELGLQHLGAVGQPLVDLSEALPDVLALGGEPGESGTHLVARQLPVCHQIKQILFLPVELPQFALKLLVQEPGAAGGFVERLRHGRSHLMHEVLGESLGAPVPLDRVFKSVEREVRQVAAAALPTGAEHVEVAATLACRHGDDQAPTVASGVAAGAPHAALEVVVVGAPSFATLAARIQNALRSQKQLFAHERRMAAGVFGTLEGDDAEVVAVAQHRRQFRVTDGSGWVATRTGAEAARRELVGHVLQAVLAGGV